MSDKQIVGKEIHLKKRPTGFVTEDDFEIVELVIPELKREGEFLVRNIWMSVDPWMRIYMVKASRIMPPVELNKPLNGGCIGQIIESRSDKFKVGEYVKAMVLVPSYLHTAKKRISMVLLLLLLLFNPKSP